MYVTAVGQFLTSSLVRLNKLNVKEMFHIYLFIL